MIDNYDSSEYDQLPVCIKCMYTLDEWAWLPADEKRNIIDDNTLPEVTND